MEVVCIVTICVWTDGVQLLTLSATSGFTACVLIPTHFLRLLALWHYFGDQQFQVYRFNHNQKLI